MGNVNAEVIKGLREYADFLEQHPELPEIYVGNAGVFSTWGGGDIKQLAATVARAFGGKVAKDYSGDNFRMQKTFSGGVDLVFSADRDKVCERVQVGSKIEPEHVIPAKAEEVIPEREIPVYEWRCGSILAPSETETILAAEEDKYADIHL